METSFLKTCYVSPHGSDENTGGERDPFRTVSRALAEAEPGTRILVRPGGYVERIEVPVSGMPGRPVVIEGARYGCGAIRQVVRYPLLRGGDIQIGRVTDGSIDRTGDTP